MFEEYDKKKTYLVACSGGPDSMALLDMLLKEEFNLIVAHVNYKTRNESDSEEALVKTYCKMHNIRYFIDYFDNNYKGSFEVAAREFRYNFFSKIYFENNCDGLFVAHHKDDLLETYLLKKQRNVVNESYLILKETKIKKMMVLRPLLQSYYKKDLLDYCKKNDVPYGIDFTNFMDIHPRNVIRKKLESMDKEAVYKAAMDDENLLIETRKNVKEFIKYYPAFTIEMLMDKSDLWLMIFLYEACERKYRKHVNKALFLKLKSFLVSNKANAFYEIYSNYYLIKNYGVIELSCFKQIEYSYTLNKLEYFSTSQFKIVSEGLKMQGVFVADDDFPITIRNYKQDDKIALKNGNKKVSRLFIDKKVPLLERLNVPVIENKDHKIIFVYNLYRSQGLKNVKNNLFISK